MGLFNSVKTPDNTTHTVSLPYGYCETAGGTAAKTVTVPNVSELTTGLAIIVRFKNSNSASSPTLNVNGLGAKNIYRYGTTKASTSTTVSGWTAGAVQLFVYNGSGWVRDYWSNTTYTNAALGQGFAICETDAATTAKTATLSGYTLVTGGIVAIQFTNGNTASNPTLNITEKGAKPIYYNGGLIDGDTFIQPDDICTFMYDSSSEAYHLLANDRWYKDIQTLNEAISEIPQADWNQNDSTATDYIKNRPFYEEIETDAIVLEETEVQLSEMAGDLPPFGLREGNNYTVTINGIDYEVICKVAEIEGISANILGNSYPLTENEDDNTDEPFLIISIPTYGMYGIYYFEESENITVEITGDITNIVQIPYKFVPNADFNIPVGSDGYIKNKPNIKNGEGMFSVIMNHPDNIASGELSYAEGQATTASGSCSHAEGYNTLASEYTSHAEGCETEASGYNSHAEGNSTTASGSCSHAEGASTEAYGSASHAEGRNSYAYGDYSHAEGGSGGGAAYNSSAYGTGSHAEGYATNAVGSHSHAEGVGPGDPNVITLSGEAGATNYVISGSTKPLDRYVMQGCVYVYKVAPGYPYVTGYDSTTSTITLSSTLDSSNALENAEVKAFYAQSGALGESSHTEGFHSGAMGNDAHAEGYFTQASGIGSHAEGQSTRATGHYSHAEGGCAGGDTMGGAGFTEAYGLNSHAEGSSTYAAGEAGHAEGYATQALDTAAHAEGIGTKASSAAQHVQGKYNIEDTTNTYAHIVGNGDSTTRSNAHTLDWDGNAWFAGDIKVGTDNKVLAKQESVDAKMDKANATGTGSFSLNRKPGTTIGTNSVTTGYNTTASGSNSLAQGYGSTASGNYSHSDGYKTTASGDYAHSEGYNTTASGDASHAEGYSSYGLPNTITSESTNDDIIAEWTSKKFTLAKGEASHAEGISTLALGKYSHAESSYTKAIGNDSHAEGYQTTASGLRSHAEGTQTTASGYASHAEGQETVASGYYSHAEGSNTKATSTDYDVIITGATTKGYYTHAEGYGTVAYGAVSHAEGNGTKASGKYSHAEGMSTTASGEGAHAEGGGTKATGKYSHAEGEDTEATASASHAGGCGTIASGSDQTVIGRYNIADTQNTYGFIVGNGTAPNDIHRKNAFTVDWSGNGVFAGGVTATSFNGYTIEKSVPSDAKFTDTTYSAATTSANGLMTSAMVTKLNGITAGAQPNVVTAVKTAGAGSGGKAVITMADGTKWYFPTLVAGSGTIATTWLPKATSSAQGIVQVGSNMTVSNGTISLTKSNVTSALGYTPTKKEFIFDTYSKSVTINPGDQSVTVGALTQRSGYTLLGYINQNGGYTDQWLISYGTYGGNVVAMVHSKYSGTLTQTISCTAIWYKNQ